MNFVRTLTTTSHTPQVGAFARKPIIGRDLSVRSTVLSARKVLMDLESFLFGVILLLLAMGIVSAVCKCCTEEQAVEQRYTTRVEEVGRIPFDQKVQG